ncbi:CPBP family intramembrane metalloprotease [Tenacibaculum sp. Mcav3-52]|uniref:CPBP family intramembrane glutamic endopeptidase n=1 Tax=Tenacibaculum sp. Mcav3-52 TaxID=2917762 RepID=UPI001EF24193|nr:CPBP family intramembrane glutamic endopeptidase [Tenacibaculum sp. Mcav3-52]MCG7503326.1 CPBP family intramembrane metalloprotease [Tenacibaculum sp. Mcav3-52]
MNFIQQAYKGENSWWRWLLIVLIVMSPFILNFSIYFLLPEVYNELMGQTVNFQGNKNIFLLESLIPFAVLMILLLIFVKLLHQRSITSLITSRKRVDWNRFFYGFTTWFLITVFFLLIGYLLAPEDFVWNFKPVPFFLLLTICIILIPIQTSLEELLFRGYLMQGIGILTNTRWVPLIVTSVLFGFMHILNPEVSKLGYGIMGFYIGTGFLFGIITLLDEGTELALGIHAANNIAAAILVASNWAVFQTDALFIDYSEPNLVFQMIIPVFLIYPLYIIILQKKYGWKNWKEKLFGNIEKPVITTK